MEEFLRAVHPEMVNGEMHRYEEEKDDRYNYAQRMVRLHVFILRVS